MLDFFDLKIVTCLLNTLSQVGTWSTWNMFFSGKQASLTSPLPPLRKIPLLNPSLTQHILASV